MNVNTRIFVFVKPVNIHKQVDLDKSWLYIPILIGEGKYIVDTASHLFPKIDIPYSTLLTTYSNMYDLGSNKLPYKYFTINKDTNELVEIEDNMVDSMRNI